MYQILSNIYKILTETVCLPEKQEDAGTSNFRD